MPLRTLTDRQKNLARHALGLPNEKNMTYRNHFWIDRAGDGYNDWQDMVENGFAVKAPGGQNWVGDFFYLTIEGARAVLAPTEHISREEAQNMRLRADREREPSQPVENSEGSAKNKVSE